VEVVGEKVPVSIPGKGVGISGQRPTYTVARIGGTLGDDPEPALGE
jgi:hypothetical protein